MNLHLMLGAKSSIELLQAMFLVFTGSSRCLASQEINADLAFMLANSILSRVLLAGLIDHGNAGFQISACCSSLSVIACQIPLTSSVCGQAACCITCSFSIDQLSCLHAEAATSNQCGDDASSRIEDSAYVPDCRQLHPDDHHSLVDDQHGGSCTEPEAASLDHVPQAAAVPVSSSGGVQNYPPPNADIAWHINGNPAQHLPKIKVQSGGIDAPDDMTPTASSFRSSSIGLEKIPEEEENPEASRECHHFEDGMPAGNPQDSLSLAEAIASQHESMGWGDAATPEAAEAQQDYALAEVTAGHAGSTDFISNVIPGPGEEPWHLQNHPAGSDDSQDIHSQSQDDRSVSAGSFQDSQDHGSPHRQSVSSLQYPQRMPLLSPPASLGDAASQVWQRTVPSQCLSDSDRRSFASFDSMDDHASSGRLGPDSQHIIDIRNDEDHDTDDSTIGEDDAMIGTSIGYDVTSVGSVMDHEPAATARTSLRHGGGSSMGYAVSTLDASSWQEPGESQAPASHLSLHASTAEMQQQRQQGAEDANVGKLVKAGL